MDVICISLFVFTCGVFELSDPDCAILNFLLFSKQKEFEQNATHRKQLGTKARI